MLWLKALCLRRMREDKSNSTCFRWVKHGLLPKGKDLRKLKRSREVCAEENTLPKRKEVRGSRRELYNADILNFTLHQILWVMKLRTVRWTGHVVMRGSVKSAYEILVRSPEKEMQLLTQMSKWRGCCYILFDTF